MPTLIALIAGCSSTLLLFMLVLSWWARRARRPADQPQAVISGCGVGCLGLSMLLLAGGCALPRLTALLGPVGVAETTAPIRALGPALIGQAVLLEGTMSTENRIDAFGLVAGEHRIRGSRRMRTVSLQTPPMLVTLASGAGTAQIEDPDAFAAASYEMIYGGANVHPPPAPGQEVYGFTAGQQILVIGVVRAGTRGPYVDAEVVYGGTRAAYLADRGLVRNRVLPLFALVFGGLALVLLIVALRKHVVAEVVAGWRRRRPWGRS